MKRLITIFTLLLTTSLLAQKPADSKTRAQVQRIFDKQIAAWNAGDLNKFMNGYWEDERLVFVGSRGPTYGYQNTLKGYQKGYPTKEAMGTLKFDIIEMRQWNRKTLQVIGKFTLIRESDTPTGHFTLLLRKIKGKWVIVSDHSS